MIFMPLIAVGHRARVLLLHVLVVELCFAHPPLNGAVNAQPHRLDHLTRTGRLGGLGLGRCCVPAEVLTIIPGALL